MARHTAVRFILPTTPGTRSRAVLEAEAEGEPCPERAARLAFKLRPADAQSVSFLGPSVSFPHKLLRWSLLHYHLRSGHSVTKAGVLKPHEHRNLLEGW